MEITLTIEQLAAFGAIGATVGGWIVNYKAQAARMRKLEHNLANVRLAVAQLQGEKRMEGLKEYISGEEEEK